MTISDRGFIEVDPHTMLTSRPGVYATEVNIQNITGRPALVAKFFVPLINAGAVVGREPKFADPAKVS